MDTLKSRLGWTAWDMGMGSAVGVLSGAASAVFLWLLGRAIRLRHERLLHDQADIGPTKAGGVHHGSSGGIASCGPRLLARDDVEGASLEAGELVIPRVMEARHDHPMLEAQHHLDQAGHAGRGS